MAVETLQVPYPVETKVVDADEGVVTALVAVTGNLDLANDVLAPGAVRPIGDLKVFDSHDSRSVIGRTVEVRELPPGDPGLPDDLRARGLGAVQATMRLNLDKQAARDVLSDLKFHPDWGWSIGYVTRARKYDGGVRHLEEVELVEISATALPANTESRTVAVKSLADTLDSLAEQALDAADELRRVETKRAVPAHSTETVMRPWDAARILRNVRSGEDADYYRRIFAWQDGEADPTTERAWKLPHHEVSGDGEGGPANVQACRVAIGVLNGARGGVDIPAGDREAVWRHLARHLRDAEIEPAELRSAAGGVRPLLTELKQAVAAIEAALSEPGEVAAEVLGDAVAVPEVSQVAASPPTVSTSSTNVSADWVTDIRDTAQQALDAVVSSSTGDEPGPGGDGGADDDLVVLDVASLDELAGL